MLDDQSIIDINLNSPAWENFAVQQWNIDNEQEAILRQYRIFIGSIIHRVFDVLEINAPFEVSLLLTDNDEIQSLNKQFRQKDKPTNVLSFPFEEEDDDDYDDDEYHDGDEHQDEDEDHHDHESHDDDDVSSSWYMGDIAFAYGVIDEERKAENKPFLDHFTHLIVHGILHLMGFDHETEEDAVNMEAIEVEVLETLHIHNPYS